MKKSELQKLIKEAIAEIKQENLNENPALRSLGRVAARAAGAAVGAKLADKYFAGWSWIIISTEVLGSEAFVVHGRLKWYEGGIWREGDMTAAHRIQKLKHDPNKFSDIGNDIKAANTDCMKKAFNMYMNIADDVYKNRVDVLTQEDIDYIYKEMEGLKEEWKTQISNSIKNGDIERADILRVINKINRLKEELNNG